jgi:hypothetical protein
MVRFGLKKKNIIILFSGKMVSIIKGVGLMDRKMVLEFRSILMEVFLLEFLNKEKKMRSERLSIQMEVFLLGIFFLEKKMALESRLQTKEKFMINIGDLVCLRFILEIMKKRRFYMRLKRGLQIHNHLSPIVLTPLVVKILPCVEVMSLEIYYKYLRILILIIIIETLIDMVNLSQLWLNFEIS